MPKIRIDPINISGDTSIAHRRSGHWINECAEWDSVTGQCYRWRYRFDSEVFKHNSRNDTLLNRIGFDFSNSLGSYVPENAYITGFNIYFNLLSGEIEANKAFDVRMNDLTFKIPHTNVEGWNKVSIDPQNVPDLSKTNSLTLDFKGLYLYNKQFLTKTTYPPDGRGNAESEYYMPDYYIYEYCNLTSSYPPYIEIEYQYNAPQASKDLNPNGVTVNPRGPLHFSWNSLINQTQFEFQYRVEGKNWSTSVVEKTANRYYDMPPNTIREGSGNVEWRVRVMEESGVYSDWTTANFTIGVVAQEPPRIVAPLGDYIKNGAPTTFEWDFIAGTTEEQKAFEIEVVLPTETKKFSGQGTETKFTTDLGIKDSIVVYWRMRVQNSFDEWSKWTDRASYQTIGIPPAPQIISVENNNRPLVQWTSREQESYQLQIEKVDGEVVFKTDSILGATVREYKVKEVLPNGKYVFVLKVTNAYGIESQPIRFTHIIDPAPISKPTVRLFKSDYFVQIESDSLEGEVLRDEKVIGYLNQGKFRDYSGANYKTYSYQVRAFKDDVVGLSDKVGGVTEFGEFNTLATVDKLEDFFLIKYGLNESIKKVYSFEVQGAAISLEGKKYPFYEFDNHARASFNLSFYLENMDQVIKLQSLIEKKKEFLLRENRGTNRQGTIQGVNVEYDVLGYLVTCTLIIIGEDYE